MKYMYTTKPYGSTREILPGVYGRAVNTCEKTYLLSLGWVYHPEELKNALHEKNEKIKKDEHGENGKGYDKRLRAKEKSNKEKINIYDHAKDLGINIYDDNDKQIHHRKLAKMVKEHVNNQG